MRKLLADLTILRVLVMASIWRTKQITVRQKVQLNASKDFSPPYRRSGARSKQTFSKEMTTATAENETTLQTIMTALQEQGIALEDIQTSNYSLWAEQIYANEARKASPAIGCLTRTRW